MNAPSTTCDGDTRVAERPRCSTPSRGILVPTLVACRIRNYPNNSARANRRWLPLVAWGLSTVVVTASVLGLIVWLGDRNEEPIR